MLNELFGDVENPDLIDIALTHPSFTQENNLSSLQNYERLEFFGDSVLKLFTSKLLYQKYPKAPEGELSKIRSILVSDSILAKVAKQLKINLLMNLGPSEEKQGGRNRDSNVACMLEALLGAFYFNNKQKEIEKFISDYIMVYADDIDNHFEKYNAKDILQQYTQGYDKTLPEYRTVDIKGPAHKPVFVVEIYWNGQIIAKAEGKSKKEAQQNCAYDACKKLGIIK